MNKRYYSLRAYYKDFPKKDGLSYKLAGYCIKTQGYIDIIEIRPTEKDRIRHREVCDFIKRMEKAEKEASKRKFRVKGLESVA